MRKQFAGLRTRFVHRAEIPFEKHAAALAPPENPPFLFRLNRIGLEKRANTDAQMTRQFLNVALRNLRRRYPAAIRACGAVNRLLGRGGNGFKAFLNEVMAFHPNPEALV